MNGENIYKRMALVTAELPIVAKNLFVETSKDKGYNAVSERDIKEAVKPLETKYGIFSFPVNREIVDDEILQSETQYGMKTTFFSRIKTTYRFVNIEMPDDYIEIVSFSEGIDSQDKGSGKAMTYGDKYCLMAAYKICTGDDPDKDASTPEHYEAVPKSNKCADCGETITASVAKYSMQNYRRPLCMKCQGKAKNAAQAVATTEKGDKRA